MGKYGKMKLGTTVEINTQVVNGRCPFCKADSLLVSIHKTIFRCMHCGSDIEQKVNGKISYIPLGGNIHMVDNTRDLTNG